MLERRKIRISKFVRAMESVELKYTRDEANEFYAIAEESRPKANEATRQLTEFQSSM